MKSVDRKNEILESAFSLSKCSGGWIDLTRREVAEHAKCAEGLINKYFGTMENLKEEVMRLAITRKTQNILEQGVVYSNHKLAAKTLNELKV